MACKVHSFRGFWRHLDIVPISTNISGGGEVLSAKKGDKKVDMDSQGDKLGVDNGDVRPDVTKKALVFVEGRYDQHLLLFQSLLGSIAGEPSR